MPETDKRLIDELDGVIALHKLRSMQVSCPPIRRDRSMRNLSSDDGRFGEAAEIPKTPCQEPLSSAPRERMTPWPRESALRLIHGSLVGIVRMLRSIEKADLAIRLSERAIAQSRVLLRDARSCQVGKCRRSKC